MSSEGLKALCGYESSSNDSHSPQPDKLNVVVDKSSTHGESAEFNSQYLPSTSNAKEKHDDADESSSSDGRNDITTDTSTSTPSSNSNSDDSDDDDEGDNFAMSSNQDGICSIEMFSDKIRRHRTKLAAALVRGQKLDNPFRNSNKPNELIKSSDSVFSIEHLQQEKSSAAALERHVKMTPVVGTQSKINGKSICWNHRRGKCRFGAKCTYAHDSDIISPTSKTPDKATSSVTSLPSSTLASLASNQTELPTTECPDFTHAYFTSDAQLGGRRQAKQQPKSSEDEEEASTASKGTGKGKRKRPGLSQTLTPGKKVMNKYFDEKKKEQK